MGFSVRSLVATAGDRTGEVYELGSANEAVRAEVWPQWGFNCLTWQVRQPDDSWADIFFSMPDWTTNPVPTRSGHPILFPFPGRLRQGRFTFEGREYQLPLTDATRQHAIHGFTPRHRWRVVDSRTGADFATVTGEFHLARDLPEAVGQWPSDFQLRVTYRLQTDHLRVEAAIHNVGSGRLPCGLGYHGYFRIPGMPEPDIGRCVLQAYGEQLWRSENQLPTGERHNLLPELDFRHGQSIGKTALDHVFTGLNGPPVDGGMIELARLSHPAIAGVLQVVADRSFRELVLFTPPHRQAIAIEPYTCSADAANLAAQGVDSGWRVLERDAVWNTTVEYRWARTAA